MRLFGLVCTVVATACASASPPSEAVDAKAIDAQVIGSIDAGVDARLPDASGPNLCASTVTCATAMMLGTISGDTGAGVLTATGYQSAWFRVRVSEDDDDLLGIYMSVTSKLTFPATVGFETYVYLNPNSDVAAECTITTGTRATVGNVQTVEAQWGETGAFSNGSSDDRNVTIEVRPVGTNCAASAPWSLEVIGNS